LRLADHTRWGDLPRPNRLKLASTCVRDSAFHPGGVCGTRHLGSTGPLLCASDCIHIIWRIQIDSRMQMASADQRQHCMHVHPQVSSKISTSSANNEYSLTNSSASTSLVVGRPWWCSKMLRAEAMLCAEAMRHQSGVVRPGISLSRCSESALPARSCGRRCSCPRRRGGMFSLLSVSAHERAPARKRRGLAILGTYKAPRGE
jgi:hypothetical protein